MKIKQTLLSMVLIMMSTAVLAQSYTDAPYWAGHVSFPGALAIGKKMAFNFPDSVIRITELNPESPVANPDYSQAWQMYHIDTLIGQGAELLTFNNLPDTPNGWRGQARLIDLATGQMIIGPVALFGGINGIYPQQPMQVTVPDPLDFQGSWVPFGYITYNPSFQTLYDPPDGEVYNLKFYARLEKCDGSWGVTWSSVITSISQAQGLNPGFTLPLNVTGDFKMSYWVTADHMSVTPDNWTGELAVWGTTLPCFTMISTSVEDNGEVLELKASPNPFVDVLSVTSPEATDYHIYDMTGKEVANGRLVIGKNDLGAPCAMPGTYFLETIQGGKPVVIRIMKQ